MDEKPDASSDPTAKLQPIGEDETVIYAYGDSINIEELQEIQSGPRLTSTPEDETKKELSCSVLPKNTSTPRSLGTSCNPGHTSSKLQFLSVSSSSSLESLIEVDVEQERSLLHECFTISSEHSDSDSMPSLSTKYRKTESQQQFYNNNTKLPVYSTPSVGLEAKEIISLCFGELSNEKICQEKPVSVRANSVFVIDLSNVSLKSLYADDNGVWETASPRRYYKVSLESGKVSTVLTANRHDYTHMMKRQYGRHKQTFEDNGSVFQRIISTVKSKHDTDSRYAVIQYLLKNCQESDISMAPHGNSLGKRPFFKTDPIVIDRIKESTCTKPKMVFHDVLQQAGSLSSASPSVQPRNIKQIYNVNWDMKQQVKEEGPTDFAHLFSQIKENEFVRDLTITADSIQYVLASNQQLSDLESFCTLENQFSVFSLDSTFDLGEFYLTNTCFKNPRIVHADGKYRGKHPLVHGPSFIHNKKETNNYVTFLASLIRMNPKLSNIRAVGTDGEEAIMNASVICFPNTIQLLCVDHKKENIQRKLAEYRGSEAARKHIMADIFGRNVGSTYEQGLIDCTSVDNFDKKCKDMKGTWDHLFPGFHVWFIQYQSELFKQHLIKAICKKANVEGTFSNNGVESMNRNVKEWVGRKQKSSMPTINIKIQDLVLAQKQEFEMAVYGQGDYDLADDFSYLRKERHEWNSLNCNERQTCLDKFWKAKPKTRLSTFSASDERSDMPAFNASYLQETSRQALPEQRVGLSLQYSADFIFAGVTEDHFKAMWEKANTLRSIPDAIVKSPGYGGCYVMHSSQSKAIPHLVTCKSSGKVTCSDCPTFQNLKCCPHALAGADFLGCLNKFVSRKQKVVCPETATSDILFSGVKGGKKKVLKPRRGGRAPLDASEPESIVQRPVDETVNTDETVLNMIDNLQQENKFELIYLFQTKAIKCYGCSEKFDRNAEHNLLVVRCFCEREFTLSGEKRKKWQYAYFHLMMPCIRKKFGDFEMNNLTLGKEVENVMSTNLKDKLASLGIKM